MVGCEVELKWLDKKRFTLQDTLILLQAVNMNSLIYETGFHSVDFSADWRLVLNTNYL